MLNLQEFAGFQTTHLKQHYQLVGDSRASMDHANMTFSTQNDHLVNMNVSSLPLELGVVHQYLHNM